MSRDEVESLFRDLFRDLAVASRSLSSYPVGHPLAASSLVNASASVAKLLSVTGPVDLVATRDALLLGERRFAETGPARLAALLRRRRSASLGLRPGVNAGELERLLRGLALEPRLAHRAPTLGRELAEAGVAGVVVADLDFSSLVLVEGGAGAAEEGLWTRIARRLYRAGDLPAESVDRWLEGGGSVAALLRSMLGGARGSAAGDGVAALSEERLADEAVAAFAEGGGVDPAELAELAGSLGPGARGRLARELERTLATREDGGRTLTVFFSALSSEAREGMAIPAAVAIAPAATPASGTGAAGAGPAAPAADPARLARLRRTFTTADIDILADEIAATDPAVALLELAGEEPGAAPDPALEAEFESGGIARTVAASLLELAERPETTESALVSLLAKVEGAYRTLLGAGRLRLALELVERIQRRAKKSDEAAPHFKRCGERLAKRDSLAALTRSLAQLSPEGIRVARQLVERLGPVAARHLIGQLAEAEDRELRRRLLDLLADLGPLVVRDATSLLGDTRWYVVRNVLLLLRRVGDPGSVAAIRKCAEHPDLRVRLEAIRNLFAFDQELPRELLRQALAHKDPRLAGEAIELAGEHQMHEAGELLVELLRRADPFGARRSARLKAIRALAQIGDPAHLSGLRRFAARFTLLPVNRQERLAFYESLASYPAEAVRPWIARGLRSKEVEIRRVAEELERAASRNEPKPAEPASAVPPPTTDAAEPTDEAPA